MVSSAALTMMLRYPATSHPRQHWAWQVPKEISISILPQAATGRQGHA